MSENFIIAYNMLFQEICCKWQFSWLYFPTVLRILCFQKCHFSLKIKICIHNLSCIRKLKTMCPKATNTDQDSDDSDESFSPDFEEIWFWNPRWKFWFWSYARRGGMNILTFIVFLSVFYTLLLILKFYYFIIKGSVFVKLWIKHYVKNIYN